MHWIDNNGSSTTSEDQHLTRIMVTLWDIGSSLNRLSEVTGVAVAQFSPNGQYLAVERVSQNAVELWNFEDSKITHRFLYPFVNPLSLHFLPTSDCLIGESCHNCLWKLDTKQMVSFDLDVGYRSPHANHVFTPKHRTVKI